MTRKSRNQPRVHSNLDSKFCQVHNRLQVYQGGNKVSVAVSAPMHAVAVRRLPAGDPRLPALRETARRHRDAGLAAVTGEHYAGGHWLASFATYLVTGRGLR